MDWPGGRNSRATQAGIHHLCPPSPRHPHSRPLLKSFNRRFQDWGGDGQCFRRSRDPGPGTQGGRHPCSVPRTDSRGPKCRVYTSHGTFGGSGKSELGYRGGPTLPNPAGQLRRSIWQPDAGRGMGLEGYQGRRHPCRVPRTDSRVAWRRRVGGAMGLAPGVFNPAAIAAVWVGQRGGWLAATNFCKCTSGSPRLGLSSLSPRRWCRAG